MDAPANQAKRCFSRPWLTYFTATGVAQTPPDALARRSFDDSVKTALSGQTLTKDLAGREFEYEDLGAQELKGITGTVSAWAVNRVLVVV
jgi:hypothetical protein